MDEQKLQKYINKYLDITYGSISINPKEEDLNQLILSEKKSHRIAEYDPDNNILFVYKDIVTDVSNTFSLPNSIQYLRFWMSDKLDLQVTKVY